MTLGGAMLLAVATAGMLLLSALAYWRNLEADPGLTTETALVLTVLLGGLAVGEPALAASLGVVVTALLAARSPLHHFVKKVLTNFEIRDALIFGVATLVVLPLLPDRTMGPFGALNPYAIWVLVILIMAVGAAGHIATRLAGTRFGLPFSGFVSGFISSTATIGAMGAHARETPSALTPAVAGAVLSTMATIIYLAIVIGITDIAVLKVMLRPLIYAGIAASFYGALFTFRVTREADTTMEPRSRAFSLPMALGLAATLSTILIVTATAQAWFHDAGTTLVAGLAGFVDTQSAAISVTSLAAAGKMQPVDAVIPILAGVTTNTVSKVIFAATAGGRAFAVRVIPGLLLVNGAAWLGALGISP